MGSSAIVRLVFVGALSILGSSVAAASPATELGDAYRAYDQGDLVTAAAIVGKLDDRQLHADDYALWLRGMIALRTGDGRTATTTFRALGKRGSSRYGAQVPWRLADAAWVSGDRAEAARAYAKLVDGKDAGSVGDVGTARFRIAQARTGKAAQVAYRAMAIAHPSHPLAGRAEAALTTPFSATERLARARNLTEAHQWDEAIAELALVDAPADSELARQHDYWLGITLFKMRRRYADAGDLLLNVYAKLGGNEAEAMFHGARALSRADRDDEAITWYRKVVASYPHTAYAEEAQYLSGWLEFNRGKYADAIAPLERMLDRYPKSKFADDALWFLGMSHYFLGALQ
ncbi:MAG: tetratricopeptide repeat protein, partial [Proteobacteria bacterium]|nr:tetratricopeptide repeat protein [Pseudomonadota bacterium]